MVLAIWIDVIGLLLGLIIILISCEMFTNSIEWLGKIMGVGEGVVGSIFSAVGTCLPETSIPIITIVFSHKADNLQNIGIGAIVGAPFMLSTLAFFVTGLSVLVFNYKRKTRFNMFVNSKILSRDIGFFIAAYCTGIMATFINPGFVRNLVVCFLVVFYLFYVFLTFKSDNYFVGNKLEKLYASRYFGVKPGLLAVVIQNIIALAGILFGAEVFVKNVESVSNMLVISTLVLSFIVTPIATELPEKFNSILWIRRKKDTLALGNITGAMVFQSCIPVAIGIYATPWVLNEKLILSAIFAIISSLIVFIYIKTKGKLSPIPLIMGGALYLLFIIYLTSF